MNYPFILDWSDLLPTTDRLFVFSLFVSAVVFLCILIVLFGLMSWLVLYPVPFLQMLLKLYDISDMNFKLLLVALAALNFLTCFLLEVQHSAHYRLLVLLRVYRVDFSIGGMSYLTGVTESCNLKVGVFWVLYYLSSCRWWLTGACSTVVCSEGGMSPRSNTNVWMSSCRTRLPGPLWTNPYPHPSAQSLAWASVRLASYGTILFHQPRVPRFPELGPLCPIEKSEPNSFQCNVFISGGVCNTMPLVLLWMQYEVVQSIKPFLINKSAGITQISLSHDTLL